MPASESLIHSPVEHKSRRTEFESYLEFRDLAPHLGYVSNFSVPAYALIELVKALAFQFDWWSTPSRVHIGYPAWIRLELSH